MSVPITRPVVRCLAAPISRRPRPVPTSRTFRRPPLDHADHFIAMAEFSSHRVIDHKRSFGQQQRGRKIEAFVREHQTPDAEIITEDGDDQRRDSEQAEVQYDARGIDSVLTLLILPWL